VEECQGSWVGYRDVGFFENGYGCFSQKASLVFGTFDLFRSNQ
jgi:hypothetical protein